MGLFYFMIERYRVGKLEFREATYLRKPPKHITYDIVKWIPNVFYGKKSEFIKVDEHTYRHPDITDYTVNASCFENPESCIVIASFRYKYGKYYYKFIGNKKCAVNSEHLTKVVNYGKKQLKIDG